MNWDAIGAVGEIVGAIAVVVTLAYLAVQIRQSSTMLQGSSYQMWLSANVELNNAANQLAHSGTFYAGNLDSRNLKEESFLEFAMWYTSFFQMVQATDYLYRQGCLDRGLWEAELGRAALLLKMPGVRELWEAGVRTTMPPDFVAQLESTTPTMTAWNWNAERGFHALEAAET